MRFKSKGEVKNFVWKRIEPFLIPPIPVTGRIPNFMGSKKACEMIRKLEKHRKSRIVFSAPDSPLITVRKVVLEDGKDLLAIKPRITGFLLLRGRKVSARDVTIRGMIRNGLEIKEFELEKVGKVDVFIQGCVAIDKMGNRIWER